MTDFREPSPADRRSRFALPTPEEIDRSNWLTNTGPNNCGQPCAVEVDFGVVVFDHDAARNGPPLYYRGAALGPYRKPERISDEAMVELGAVGIYGPHPGRYISAEEAEKLGAGRRECRYMDETEALKRTEADPWAWDDEVLP